jgi:hypothetical protein
MACTTGFCAGPGLDQTNCGPLPSEACTALAAAAAAGIARRLKAYRKNKSEANAAALREALWPGAGGGLQAFCREYQKYKTRPEDVRVLIDGLLCVEGENGC